MASINTLPIKIILQIAEHLGLSDLVALSATNRCHNAVVMENPILFRKLDTAARRFGLLVAAFSGHTKVVKLLLDSGIHPNFYLRGPMNPRTVSTSYFGATSRLYVVGKRFDPDLYRKRQIKDASYLNGIVWRLWSHHACSNNWCSTPLHMAAYMGNNEVVGLLIERGANLSLLSYGICRCKFPICLSRDTLLAKYSAIHQPETKHLPCSALHLALSAMHLYTAKLIINYGAPMYLTSRSPAEHGHTSNIMRSNPAPSIVHRLFDGSYQEGSRIIKYVVGLDTTKPILDDAEKAFNHRR
ncbi:hypothetical protein F4781DRAFT_344958 [Annulohypoxylon bovei var. microspora]|nr:hypothetical protein F4781DRAFT_344958 [Annulohypoxylon bovei var. microspora]